MSKQLEKPAAKPTDTQGREATGPADQFPEPTSVVGEATPGTPDGMGRAYEPEATGSGNAHSKMSATPAGGDPIRSPVIGNPGEARRDMGYDYGLAGSVSPQIGPVDRQLHQPLQQVPIIVQMPPPVPEDTTEYAERVRARRKGHYDGLREVGDIFDNSRNLATYPQDQASWFEDASAPPVEDVTPRQRLRQSQRDAKDKDANK